MRIALVATYTYPLAMWLRYVPAFLMRRGGDAEELAVAGGCLESVGNRAVVRADAAERAEDIDIDRAEAAMKRAQERVASHDSDVDLERALAQVARARTRVAVARKRRRPERV